MKITLGLLALALPSVLCGPFPIRFFENAQPIFSANPNNPTGSVSYRIGSPVLTKPAKIHLVFYGNMAPPMNVFPSSGLPVALMSDFVKNVGSSDWIKPLRKYYYQATSSSPKEYVSASFSLGKVVQKNTFLGTSLTHEDIPKILQNQISTGAIPENPDDIYIVVLGKDVSQTVSSGNLTVNLCADYCAYHTDMLSQNQKRLAYGMVYHPVGCRNCVADPIIFNSPNVYPPADAMVNTLASELVEIVTSPYNSVATSWSHDEYEAGDMCEWDFGKTISLGPGWPTRVPGGIYNTVVGGKKFLLQRVFDPVLNQCVQP